jgi:predicted nucleic acid-binding protein
MTEPEIDLNKLVILDNTVLSNFAMVQRTDLVTGIWQNCATTPDAWNEFMTGVTLKRIPRKMQKPYLAGIGAVTISFGLKQG